MSDFKRLSEEIINSFDDVVSEICMQLSSFSDDVIVMMVVKNTSNAAVCF